MLRSQEELEILVLEKAQALAYYQQLIQDISERIDVLEAEATAAKYEALRVLSAPLPDHISECDASSEHKAVAAHWYHAQQCTAITVLLTRHLDHFRRLQMVAQSNLQHI